MELTDKKIVLTGGAGFLGTHVFNKLIDRGVPRENIFIPRSADLDLRKIEDCERAVNGRQVVIHTAGVTGNAEFHKAHPGSIFYDNLTMGVQLMDAARRAGVEKFVTIGSATEYPLNVPMPLNEENLWLGPVEENHAPYTIAKKMLLVEAQAYRNQYGFNAIHLLLTNMYGPGEKIDGGPIPSLIKRVADAKAAGNDSVAVWGSGNATRDFLYVQDAAEGIVLAAEHYDKSEPVNLGSGYEVSIRELTTAIGALMGFKGKFIFDATKPEGQLRRMLEVSRAAKEFGFHATMDFEKGLQKTITSHGY
jgi:GDP-L-fucose synthase